jgi:hypothetical protein
VWEGAVDLRDGPERQDAKQSLGWETGGEVFQRSSADGL